MITEGAFSASLQINSRLRVEYKTGTIEHLKEAGDLLRGMFKGRDSLEVINELHDEIRGGETPLGMRVFECKVTLEGYVGTYRREWHV